MRVIICVLVAISPGVLCAAPIHWTANGHLYEAVYVPDGISWTSAKAAAELAGGYLATITSAEENQFVFNLIDDPKYWHGAISANHGPWLGGLQKRGAREPDGGWTWVTGEPFAYTAWHPGEPSGSWGGVNEDRLHYLCSPGTRVATWNDMWDQPGIALFGYVLEYETFESIAIRLMVSSTPGGSVVVPGEGTFAYDDGSLAPVEAVAEEGWQFTRWSGTAVDANVMLDPCAPHTSVTMDAAYSLVAHFKPQEEPWSTVYFNDFEGDVGFEWSQNLVDATPIGERHFLGQFGNDTVTLTLADLAPHTHIRLTFDLFILRTWDGDYSLYYGELLHPTGFGPDIWSLATDSGLLLLETTFSNSYEPKHLGSKQSFPYWYGQGQADPTTGVAERGSLGYFRPDGFTADSVYHIVVASSHLADSLSVGFSASGLGGGWGGAVVDDESWGLDNVRVEVLHSDVELAASSTEGGSVVMAGEGTFTYTYDALVPVEAVAEEGYQFTHWSGTAIDANAMLDPCAPHTSVIMDANYSLVAHFKPQDEPWSTVYFNDFEDRVGPEWSRTLVDATPVGARRFLGQFCRDDSVALTLVDLGTHSDVRVSFDLFVLRSWDGDGLPDPLGVYPDESPDIWTLDVQEGPTLLRTTFDNHWTPRFSYHRQSYPHEYPYGESLPQTGAAEVRTLGYSWQWPDFPESRESTDSVYHINCSFAHSSSSVELSFSALLSDLGLPNESWGLDNVRVEVLAPVSDVTLTVSSTAGGSVTQPGEGQFKYLSGTAVAIQAVAAAHYHFTHWSGTAVDAGAVANPTSATTTVVVSADYTLIANFATDQRTLTVSSEAGGSVTAPGQGSFQYPHGASVLVQVVAKAHYQFTHWSGTAVDAGKVADPASASTSVIVDADYTLVANFKIDQHRLTVTAAEGGSIYVETRVGDVMKPWYDGPVPPLDHGTEVTIIATPYGGWRFTGWSGTMGSTESPFIFELTQDCHLEAEFVPE